MRLPNALVLVISCLLLCCSSPLAFAQLPHVFRNGDIADADQINESLNYLQEEIDKLDSKATCSATGSAVIGTWRGTAANDGEYEIITLTLRSGGSLSGFSITAEFGVVSVTGTWTFSSSCRLDASASASASATSTLGSRTTAVGYLSDGGDSMAGLLYNSRTDKWGASDLVRFNR